MSQIHLHKIDYFTPIYGNACIAWVEWCDTVKTHKRRAIIESKQLQLEYLEDWPIEVLEALRYIVDNTNYLVREIG